MVAIKSHQSDNYIKEPQSSILAYLIYGTDEGRISENAALLARSWSAKFGDGGDILRLDDRAMADNPDILAIEIRSTPMFGGRSVLRVNASPRIKADLVGELIDLEPQNLLIIEAGNLKPSSPLRKLFDKSKKAAALACFPDEGRDITRLVDEELCNKGHRITPDARKTLIASLGSDRGVSRQELIKLALYAHGKDQIDVDDVLINVGDSSQLAYDQLIAQIMGGQASAALSNLERLLASGQSCAGLNTMLGRHLARLYKLRSQIDAGQDIKSAMAKLRPPVHFKQRDSVAAQASRLSLPALKKAIHLVQETVWRSRTHADMEQTGTERMILILSRLAASPRR